jgi:HPt (histidine-containing phosphotransfer) domain-containing protein
MSTAPILDPKSIELLRTLDANSPGAMAELLRMFVADAPSLLSRIEIAHAGRDTDALRQSAHYLRSSALAVGASALAEAAHSVEHLAAGDGDDRADALLHGLRAALRDAILALLQQIREL